MVGAVDDAGVADEARLVLILRGPAGAASGRCLPASAVDSRRIPGARCYALSFKGWRTGILGLIAHACVATLEVAAVGCRRRSDQDSDRETKDER